MVQIEGAHSGSDTTPAQSGYYQHDLTEWEEVAAKTLPGSLKTMGFYTVGTMAYLIGGASPTWTATNAIAEASLSDLTTWSASAEVLPSNMSVYAVFKGPGALWFYNNSAWHTASTAAPKTWTSTGVAAPAGFNASMPSAVCGSYIYHFGGYNGAYTKNIFRSLLTDPTTTTDLGALLTINKTSIPSLVRAGQWLMLFGGTSSTALEIASVGDPTRWFTISPTYPIQQNLAHAAVVGNNVYYWGGIDSINNRQGLIYAAPVDRPWEIVQITPNSVIGTPAIYNAICLGPDGRVYSFGGDVGGGANTNKIFRTVRRTPILVGPSPSPMARPAVIAQDYTPTSFSNHQRCYMKGWHVWS